MADPDLDGAAGCATMGRDPGESPSRLLCREAGRWGYPHRCSLEQARSIVPKHWQWQNEDRDEHLPAAIWNAWNGKLTRSVSHDCAEEKWYLPAAPSSVDP